MVKIKKHIHTDVMLVMETPEEAAEIKDAFIFAAAEARCRGNEALASRLEQHAMSIADACGL